MKVVEVNFTVPTPPPGSKELHWTRSIRTGKSRHQGTGEEVDYTISVSVKDRMVYVRELNSGEQAFYPFECVLRLRPEDNDQS